MKGAGMKGFTLIELLITVAILALLASAALPLAELTVQRGKEQELRRSLREVREAIDAYKRATDEGAIEKSLDKTGYPPTLSVLVEGAVDKRDPKGKRIFFLRRVPADPVSGEPWGCAAMRARGCPQGWRRCVRRLFEQRRDRVERCPLQGMVRKR